MRHAYELLDISNTTVLIHYLRDEKLAKGYAHGNATAVPERPYVRTCPSVLQSLESDCKSMSTAKAYRKQVSKIPPPTHLAVKQPRNTKQVKNIRSKVLEKQRLSHDGLYNLHELAIELPDFIHLIHTYPDLVCVCVVRNPC